MSLTSLSNGRKSKTNYQYFQDCPAKGIEMSSQDSSHPSDPLVPAPAIQLETVTAPQVETVTENTEASSAESNKKSKAEAKPTSR